MALWMLISMALAMKIKPYVAWLTNSSLNISLSSDFWTIYSIFIRAVWQSYESELFM